MIKAIRKSLPFILILIITFIFSCRKQKPEITIEISPDPMAVPVANKTPRKASVRIKGTNDTSIKVRWSSENSAIAKVTDDGLITGISVGETNIIATLANGNGIAKGRLIIYDTLDYKLRITLKDKGPVKYSLSKPQDFLSARAIAKRNKMSIAIDSADIPIASDYLSQIEKAGGKIVTQSKWLKTVSVQVSDQSFIEKFRALPFVKEVAPIWLGKKDTTAYLKTLVNISFSTAPRSVASPEYFGVAWDNIRQNNGQALHDSGYKGQGMEIAVIDAGFKDLMNNPILKNINIKGSKSFIYEKFNPFNYGNHGVYVTSCMATNKANSFVGTAPEAAYCFVVGRDEDTEFPVEEDYLVAALEYADSVGANAANISLGYIGFDKSFPAYKFEDMNGNTAFASRGANIAADKGLLVVVAAGNDRSWVGTPADAPGVLTVGGIDKNGNISSFSSYGITIDQRVKPDVLALATGDALVSLSGAYGSGNGTSFASPVMCGLATCLWQAYPKLSNKDIISVIRQSGNRYIAPLMPFGYGVADMQKAMQLAKALSESK